MPSTGIFQDAEGHFVGAFYTLSMAAYSEDPEIQKRLQHRQEQLSAGIDLLEALEDWEEE